VRPILLAALFVVALATPADGFDVNGDGLADAVTNDYIHTDSDSPGATVVFGARDRSAPASLTAPGERGFRIFSSRYGSMDGEVRAIGDVNGDGRADVMVSGAGRFLIGVVYGKADTAPVDLDTNHTAYIGFDGDPIFMSAAGDVNGDGLADIVHVRQSGGGSLARVRFGARAHPLRRHFDIYADGRLRQGPRPDLHPIGDVNGDGLDDIAVGLSDPDGRASGFEFDEMVVVVLGKKGLRDVRISQPRRHGPIAVRSRGRAAGFALRIHSARGCPCPLSDVGAAGDLNGDGLGDFAVLLESDRLYIAFGRRSRSQIRLPGRSGAVVGRVVSYMPFPAVGDIDGDGRDDLLVGAAKPRGLRLLSGRRVRRSATLRNNGRLTVRGAVDAAAVLGDFDGDGTGDVQLARQLFEHSDARPIDPQWVLFGDSPLSPVDLAHPGGGFTRLG
jgi:FG-GAP-like repeat